MTRSLMIRLILALMIFVAEGGRGAWAFEVRVAREVVNTIAADDFQGRRSGHAGGRKTEEYLARALETYGIEPGGRGYFQEFPMLVTQERGATLTLMDHELGNIPFVLGLDYTVMTHSGSGAFIAPVVIAGHGIVRPDKERNDYGDVNVNGKAVVIVRGAPDSPYDFSEDNLRPHTLAWAKERGAAAVLYYQDEHVINGAAIPDTSYDPHLPLFYIGGRVLKTLLDGLGYSIETYTDRIKSGVLPIETGKRLWISVNVSRTGPQKARNVLGIIYGTDPALRNEIVVIGAHMDHLGTNADGIVYNGADDNAAGTAIALEVARSIAADPPRRSVMVIFFAAEEDGLTGSEYFARHPTVPLANLVAMINLDSNGNGNGTVVMGGGETLGPLWNEYTATLDSTDLSRLKFYREDGHGASDYASFQRVGVPAIPFWASGQHPFYHTYNDDAQWVSDTVLQTVGTRAEEFVRFLANADGNRAAHADSVLMLARLWKLVDFGGFTVDATVSIPPLTAVTAAWLPFDGYMPAGELWRRSSELRYACEQKKITAGNLKDAIGGYQSHKPALFCGLPSNALNVLKPADVASLARQGIGMIKLSAGSASAESAPAYETARSAAMYGLIPLDFNTPARVAQWKKQGIVTGSLKDFAAAPETVRDGLLSSDALLVLEVTETPDRAQVDAIYPARARRVHLNLGSLPVHRREYHAQVVLKTLLENGLTRDDVLLLTGGNLRRFFKN